MAGFSGLGTILKMSTALGTIATTSTEADVIGDLTNISGPTMSAEEIDVSSHDSASGYREFVGGFLDAGEISLEGNLTAAGGAADLLDAFDDGLERQFHVVFPATGLTASTEFTHASAGYLRWILDGTVTGVETDAPYDDKVSFSATVRISGEPFLTASSSS